MKVKHGTCINITDQLSDEAKVTIAQWIGGATVIANQKTRQAEHDYQNWVARGKPKNQYPVYDQKAAHLSKQFEFLKTIPSQIRRNAAAKWMDSVNAFKAGLRAFPKVRPKHKKRNCYVTRELFDLQTIDDTQTQTWDPADAEPVYVHGVSYQDLAGRVDVHFGAARHASDSNPSADFQVLSVLTLAWAETKFVRASYGDVVGVHSQYRDRKAI